jgi:hypothetical protein
MRKYISKAVIVTEANSQYKYAPKKPNIKNSYGKPRRMFPDNWMSGPDPLMHDMYYAWAKHRSQANYRKEAYDLTWDDWQTIWANPIDFQNRGRKPEDLTLTRIDDDGAWTADNVEIMTRLEQLRKAMARKMQLKGMK